MKRNLLSLAVGAALVAGASASASFTPLKAPNPHTAQQPAVDGTFEKETFRQAITLPDGRIRVIVQLEDAPLALFPAVNPSVSAMAKGKITGDVDFNSKAAKEYKAVLKQQQDMVIQAARQIDAGIKATHRYDILANGFSTTIAKDKVNQLRNLPGVKAVYPDVMMHAQMDLSLDIINAFEVWESLGGDSEAGKGIKVAIIDSGLRPENPLFAGDGFTAPEGLPEDDYCATTDPEFCNGKIIVARAATLPEGFPLVEGEFANSPMAFNGHGTHVAGSAVGNWGVEGTRGDFSATIGGVAPGAYLMVYKGLYATTIDPTSSSGSTGMLVDMLEAAVADGADIINNSWGGSAAVVAPFYEEIFVAAKEAGSVMVFAAGNDGPGPGTIGHPSTSGEVLAVGMTTTQRFTPNFFSVSGSEVQDTQALPSGPIAITEDITSPIIYAGAVDEANFEGCNAWEDPETFAGSMALISRGSCFFSDKVTNATAAGAIGVIVHNNVPGEGPFGMDFGDTEITIPTAMIGTEAGLAAAEYLSGDVTDAQATLTAGVPTPDVISAGSSKGPNADPTILKPNLAAPGVQIFSGESPLAPGHEGEDFSFKGGTSMASPHVAGAAALIKQMNPDWSVDQIMSAVTHTAVREGLLKPDLESAADWFDIGAGRLDVERASKAQLTYSELGLANPACFEQCSWTFTVTNTSDSDISVMVDDYIMGPGYEMTVSPADATLPAGAEAEITVTVNATAAQVFDTWIFGGIEWDDGNADTPEYFMPIAVNAINADNAALFSSAASADAVAVGETTTLTATVNNSNLAEGITLTAQFADEFVTDASSVSATVGGEAQTVSFDAATNSAAWTGSLGTASFAIAPNDWPAQQLGAFGIPGYFSMADFGAAPLTCSATCDDSFVSINTAPITYLGQEYTTMHISSNGFVVLGDDDTGANFSRTQPLPSSDAPNNVIAPLWMDLDLAGGDGAGEIYATDLNLNSDFGCGPCNDYFIVEWRGAEIYQVPGEAYTFQIWFEKGTGEAYFYYGEVGSLPDMLNQFGLGLTVGAEDATGSVGLTFARIDADGTRTGTFPASGDVWGLSVTPGETLEFAATGGLAERTALIADSMSVDEDGSVTSNVLANDLDRTVTNNFMVESGAVTARTFKSVRYDFASLDTSTLAIAEQATNGTAAVTDDGYISYTPNADYNGADSFTYTVTDMDGVAETASVDVAIAAVNDAPTISITAPSSAIEGGFYTVAVNANDVDGDDLTVTIAGVETTSLQVQAPQVDATGTSLTYDVVVSDGIETVTDSVTVQINDAPKGSSGSLAWYSLLLLPLTWMRRKKKMH